MRSWPRFGGGAGHGCSVEAVPSVGAVWGYLRPSCGDAAVAPASVGCRVAGAVLLPGLGCPYCVSLQEAVHFRERLVVTHVYHFLPLDAWTPEALCALCVVLGALSQASVGLGESLAVNTVSLSGAEGHRAVPSVIEACMFGVFPPNSGKVKFCKPTVLFLKMLGE